MLRVPVVGQLRDRVTLQQEGAPVADGGGGYAPSWSTIEAEIPARIEASGGREAILGQKLAPVVSHAVTLRWRDDVTAGMRLLWAGAPLNIRAVMDLDGRRRFLMLACDQGVAT